MLSIHDNSSSNASGWSRREWLRVGGLNALGLSLPSLLANESRASVGDVHHPTFGRAKNVIYLYLGGGPPQHETFDPKPDAPAELRGEFQPIQTNVPGIDFCELLPRSARMADKLAICRSMSTDDNVHSTSGYWVLTGTKYRGANAREIHPSDWPHIGSVVQRLKPSDTGPFGFAWLPEPIVANPGVRISGQTAGFIGRRWDPHNFTCDPQDKSFAIKDVVVPGKVTVIDYWAEWCKPCKAITKMLVELARTHPNLAIRKVEVPNFDAPVVKEHIPNVPKIPVVWVYDAQGKRVSAQVAPEVQSLRKEILTLLK